MTDDAPKGEFRIVHQAATPGEALVIRDLLESNAIPCMIPDENSPFPGVDLTPFSTASGAGCDVAVAAGDVERAKALLAVQPPQGDASE